jgi:hypothetical protein
LRVERFIQLALELAHQVRDEYSNVGVSGVHVRLCALSVELQS